MALQLLIMMKRLLCLFFLLTLAAAPGSADDFDLLRENFVTAATGSRADDGLTAKWLRSQRPDGSFRGIDYQCTQSGRWDPRKHWQALNAIARSYRFGGRNCRGAPELLDAVVRGIDNWTTGNYTVSNWWYPQIGIPLLSAEVILIMGPALPAETAVKFRPVLDRSKIGMTAQNRLRLATIHFLKGIIYRDDRMVREGREVLLEEIAFAAPGSEGLQADFSFHQHGPQLQFGNYGLEFLTAGCFWSGVMKGTRYAFPEEKSRILTNYFLNGIRWVLYADLFDFSACGRQIVGDCQSEKFRSARRAMLEELDIPSPELRREVEAFFAGTTVLEGNRLFHRSDYLVHRRKGFFFSVKMCSARVIGCESNNRENQQGRHTASGVTQFVRTGNEYRRMMPLWEWRKLPGLTAPQDDISLTPPDCTRFFLNGADLVGGVSDGRNGAAMFDCRTDNLSMRKSYFCFDRYVVAIGSGIVSDSEFPVETTVDSLRLSGEVTVGGRVLGMGKHTLAGVSELCHGNFRYRFPEPTPLTVELAEKSGRWETIQPSYREPGVKDRVLTVTIPGKADYCYILGTGSERFRRLGTDAAVHAGWDDGEQLGFALFYRPGAVEFPEPGRIEFLTPGALMVRGGKLHVSDPSQKLKALLIRIGGKVRTVRLPQGIEAGKSVALDPFG
ncbi:MAG: hypothetical protein HPZ91_14380 [Lentisphaeria bacterium]|nr:hypothetical protein [Lentisphaeria bacterium]